MSERISTRNINVEIISMRSLKIFVSHYFEFWNLKHWNILGRILHKSKCQFKIEKLNGLSFDVFKIYAISIFSIYKQKN